MSVDYEAEVNDFKARWADADDQGMAGQRVRYAMTPILDRVRDLEVMASTRDARIEDWRRQAAMNRREADDRRIAVDDQSAWTEAHKRYDGDTIISEVTGEPESFDDWGYAEEARAAFMAGVAWAREVSNA